jgi:16S rRNA (cytidine1402-2'-O)-methyltransferase
MDNKTVSKGTVYVIATPIGHLQDISVRALEILRGVHWIAAEDTRHSRKLLDHYGIQTPLKSFHEHNESHRSQAIQQALALGHDIALISDAGTPLISDPGYTLITQLTQSGFRVSPIPGCCAAIAALSAAGLATDQFLFVGFLSSKSNTRKTQLTERLHETVTQIYYEAPHRLLDCLADMASVYGDNRRAVVGRELTKTYEDFQRGSLIELHDYYQAHQEQQRGEIVILVAGNKSAATEFVEAERILKILLKELPVKAAAALTAEITGVRKHDLYQCALRIKQ